MKSLKKNGAARILAAVLLCAGMFIFIPAGKADAVPVHGTDVSTPADGNVIVEVEGTFYTNEKSQILNRINEIRREAYKEGITEEYIPVKWSCDLEEIAQIRSAEAAVYLDHLRTNGTYDLKSSNGIESWGECLAWNYDNGVMVGIEQWYEEKADLVNNTDEETGHYEAMISPSVRYVGLSAFGLKQGGWTATAMEISGAEGLNETKNSLSGDYIQRLEVQKKNIEKTAVAGAETGLTYGDQRQLRVEGTVKDDSTIAKTWYGERTVKCTFPNVTGWTSSNPQVLSVNETGMLTALHAGTADISASVNGEVISCSITAAPKNMEGSSVTLSSRLFYADGTEKIPSVTVMHDGKQLTEGTDYTVTCRNNVKPGTASLTVTGTGDYRGSVTSTYSIRYAVGSTVRYRKNRYTVTSDDTVAYAGPASKKATSVTIPDTVRLGGRKYKVTEIAFKAFYKCAKLKSVRMGNTITVIRYQAFYCCRKLTTVTMGTGLKEIERKAFYRCPSIRSLTIPKNVNKIGKQAFFKCGNLHLLVVKTRKLRASSIRNSLTSSAVTTIQVKVGKKSSNKKYRQRYKKIFKKSICGKNVKLI